MPDLVDTTDKNIPAVPKWDHLSSMYVETVQLLVKNVSIYDKLVGQFKPFIAENASVMEMIDGIYKCFQDVGKNIKTIVVKHATELDANGDPVNFNSGEISSTDGDALLMYAGVLQEYIYQQQSLADVTALGLVDLLPVLNAEASAVNAINQIRDNAIETVKKYTGVVNE